MVRCLPQSACSELGRVEVLHRDIGSEGAAFKVADDPSLEFAARAATARLLLFCALDDPAIWRDLLSIESSLSKVVLLLPFSDSEFAAFFQHGRELLGSDLPRYSALTGRFHLPGVLWFSGHSPVVRSLSELDRKAAHLADPTHPLQPLAKFALAEFLAANGLGWQTWPELNKRRWLVRAYLPLLLIVMSVIAACWWLSIRIDETQTIDKAEARMLDDQQSLQLSALMLKMLNTTQANCEGISTGDIHSRRKALRILSAPDQRLYWSLAHAAIDKAYGGASPEEVREAGTRAVSAVMASLPDNDSRRMATLGRAKKHSAADECWMYRTFLGAPGISQVDKVAIARMIGF